MTDDRASALVLDVAWALLLEALAVEDAMASAEACSTQVPAQLHVQLVCRM